MKAERCGVNGVFPTHSIARTGPISTLEWQTDDFQNFSVLPDPRKVRNQQYSLFDIISTAILAILCGYEDWEDVSLWTEEHLDWLQPLGICVEGAPSHDTYSRFFRYLDPKVMEECFIKWTQSLVGKIEGVVAIDGKTLRGDHWGVENKVHYVLDVVYEEDKCRVRKDHGAENLSVMRRAVQNMVKLEKTRKLSTNKKRTLAALNPEYRLKLLGISMTI